ncbi:ATP-dependent nuclease subunit B [Lacticaseibacillus rhamnosus]|nr:ATP-dependent nuclease subunit B [Lacticaseibacillus rhamnosus]
MLSVQGVRRCITRSPAQKSACKDLERAGQDRAITPEAAYTPTSNRAGSRSAHHNALPGAETCT